MNSNHVTLKGRILREKSCEGSYERKETNLNGKHIWCKVKPTQDKFAFYNGKKWVLTDIKNSKKLLDGDQVDWLVNSVNSDTDFE